MVNEGIGEYEAEDIRKIVARILHDLGNPEPPLNLAQVRALLNLNIGYYSTANTTLLQDVAARMKVAGKQVLQRPMLWSKRSRKLSCRHCGCLTRNVSSLTRLSPSQNIAGSRGTKSVTVSFHGTGSFLFGDNEYTLDPICHAIVEAEANYTASQLLFLQQRFSQEARDGVLEFKTINAISRRFGNTLTTTFWRMVEDRDPRFAGIRNGDGPSALPRNRHG